jgi:mRNA interferase HicA
MKRKELERRLHHVGWFLVRHGGSHDIWSDGEREIVLPRHNEINEVLDRHIVRDAEGKQ